MSKNRQIHTPFWMDTRFLIIAGLSLVCVMCLFPIDAYAAPLNFGNSVFKCSNQIINLSEEGCSSNYIFSRILCKVQYYLIKIMVDMYCSYAKELRGIMTFMVVIYVCIYGMMSAMGAIEMSVGDVIKHLLKIIFIYIVALHVGFGLRLMYKLSMGIIHEGIAIATSATTVQAVDEDSNGKLKLAIKDSSITVNNHDVALLNVESMFNNMFGLDNLGTVTTRAKNFFYITGALFAVPIIGPALGTLSLTLAITAIFLFIRAIMGYLMVIITVCLMLSMSSIFFACALFKPTYQYFDRWWKELLAQAMQPFILFLALVMFNNHIISQVDFYGHLFSHGAIDTAEGVQITDITKLNFSKVTINYDEICVWDATRNKCDKPFTKHKILAKNGDLAGKVDCFACDSTPDKDGCKEICERNPADPNHHHCSINCMNDPSKPYCLCLCAPQNVSSDSGKIKITAPLEKRFCKSIWMSYSGKIEADESISFTQAKFNQLTNAFYNRCSIQANGFIKGAPTTMMSTDGKNKMHKLATQDTPDDCKQDLLVHEQGKAFAQIAIMRILASLLLMYVLIAFIENIGTMVRVAEKNITSSGPVMTWIPPTFGTSVYDAPRYRLFGGPNIGKGMQKRMKIFGYEGFMLARNTIYHPISNTQKISRMMTGAPFAAYNYVTSELPNTIARSFISATTDMLGGDKTPDHTGDDHIGDVDSDSSVEPPDRGSTTTS